MTAVISIYFLALAIIACLPRKAGTVRSHELGVKITLYGKFVIYSHLCFSQESLILIFVARFKYYNLSFNIDRLEAKDEC